MNGYIGTDCTHAFLLWGGSNTHPLHLFQYSVFKYCIILLHCQFIKNISDNSFLSRPGSVITVHILNDIGRNSSLGNRKKVAKFLMRTFACRSTFLYGIHGRNIRVEIFQHIRKKTILFCCRRDYAFPPPLSRSANASKIATSLFSLNFFSFFTSGRDIAYVGGEGVGASWFQRQK